MFEIHKIGVHNPARVRAYVSPEAAERDDKRPVTELPSGDHGCVLDVVLEKEWEMSPPALSPVHPLELEWRTEPNITTVYFDFKEIKELPSTNTTDGLAE